MSKRTKKVGSAGRFGSRYGVRAKNRLKNIEVLQKSKHKCPTCGHQKVKRTDTSIWECRKCGTKFAGGAYLPVTDAGVSAEKIFRGEISPSEAIEPDKGEEKA